MQRNAPTIQGELEKAIMKLTGEKIRVRGASRTDSGAHAKGQVVDFLTHTNLAESRFIDALNWHLPVDIKVRGASVVPLGFNSRKDADSRTYKYVLLNSRWPSPLVRTFTHWVPVPLSISTMVEAAEYLVGTHDFSVFTVSLPPRRSPVRRVARWDVRQEGEFVTIEAQANGFLPHQVRKTNGALVQIGLGKTPPEVIKQAVDGTISELKRCPHLPAKGLCLEKVDYSQYPFQGR